MKTLLPFVKVHTCGNDFLFLDDKPELTLISKLCDRHHGLGADGIMFLSRIDGDRVHLGHYDSDGSASFCLNGIRASLAHLFDDGRIASIGKVISEGVEMGYEMHDTPRVYLPKHAIQAFQWENEGIAVNGFRVDVGNPHFLILADIELEGFQSLAPRIRADLTSFPNGTNVHLLWPQPPLWRVRSFERGVEGFTLACGSGLYAASLVLGAQRGIKEITFKPDGEGEIRTSDLGDCVMMQGKTHRVARGEWLCG